MSTRGRTARYDSGVWAARSGAVREWVLEVEEVGNDHPGRVGDGQVLPDELLSTAGLALHLTVDQRRDLAREELASITEWGIRFEAVLEAGFATEIATARDVTAARLTILLHEMTDETRHQRLFQALLGQLRPRTRWPVPDRVLSGSYRRLARLAARRPALLYTLVLAGEELVESFQRSAAEHPCTDSFVRSVYQHHLEEEADHVSFAQAVMSEMWANSTWTERVLVRRIAPGIVRLLLDTMVHPGVYLVAGLPGPATWSAARRTPQRAERRRSATRPVLAALLEAGALRPGRVPGAWRRLCDVDQYGRPHAVPGRREALAGS